MFSFHIERAQDGGTPVPGQAVCVTTHKGSWVKLLMCLISIVTRSSTHLVKTEMIKSKPGIKTLLPFLKNITEESRLENVIFKML